MKNQHDKLSGERIEKKKILDNIVKDFIENY